MRWESKARVMRVCSSLPGGNQIYKWIQKNFGNLNADPKSRLTHQLKMAEWLRSQKFEIAGKKIMEVGTGHKPIVPIGFFLMGAEQVLTYDLNRRLDVKLTGNVLEWIDQNWDQLEAQYLRFVSRQELQKRYALLSRLKKNPDQFLAEANILYLAPADACNTKISGSKIDCHISTTVLEHIPAHDISNIFSEAYRVLSKNGLAVHFIDMSDHFEHQDHRISRINFLKFSEAEWLSLAGNRFAYTNRLRVSHYINIFREAGFVIERIEKSVDDRCLKSLNGNFVVDENFGLLDNEELSTFKLDVILSKRS